MMAGLQFKPKRIDYILPSSSSLFLKQVASFSISLLQHPPESCDVLRQRSLRPQYVCTEQTIECVLLSV
jgi:hypothetical protein